MRTLVFICLLVAAVSAAPQSGVEKLDNLDALIKSKIFSHNELVKEIIKSVIVRKLNEIVPTVDYDGKIEDLINEIREGMGAPNEQFGLPTLDPLNITHLDLNLDNKLLQLKGTLDNVTVTDLQKFELDYVHLVLIPVTFSINMTLPSLVAKGSYDADGNLAGVLPVFGKGDFDIQVTNLSFAATAKVGGLPGGFLNITSISLSYELGNLHVDIEGLEGGGEFGQMVNDIINDIGTAKINELEPDLSVSIAQEVIILLNKKLNTLTISDILDLLK